MKKIILVVIGVIVVAYILGVFSTKEIHTKIDIDANSNTVWSHLIGFTQYPEWNPFIKSISGELTEGAHIHVTIQPPGGDSMNFEPRLLVVKKGEELRWIGQVLMPGLFDGEHYFKIEELSDGKVRFIHGEKFKGILALLLWGSIEAGTKQGFQAMNIALKDIAEAEVRHTKN